MNSMDPRGGLREGEAREFNEEKCRVMSSASNGCHE